jgi:hypothetical protein
MQSTNRHVAIERIDFDAKAAAASLFRRDKSGARPDKGIKSNAFTVRTIPKGVCNHGHGLDGWMKNEIGTIGAKAVDAGRTPDIRAIPAHAYPVLRHPT